jgi:hypothetical protein
MTRLVISDSHCLGCIEKEIGKSEHLVAASHRLDFSRAAGVREAGVFHGAPLCCKTEFNFDLTKETFPSKHGPQPPLDIDLTRPPEKKNDLHRRLQGRLPSQT